MASISAALLVASAGVSITMRPLRNTVTWFEISRMSSMKCEMKTIPVPWSRSRRNVANRRSISAGEVRMHAGDDLHQRALAGSILPDETVDLAGEKREANAVQGRHAGEIHG